MTISAAPEVSGAEVLIEDESSTTVTLENMEKTVISVEVTNGNDRKTYVLIFDKEIDGVEAETTMGKVASAELTETTSSVNAEAPTLVFKQMGRRLMQTKKE